ncbi:MAG TPA: hypothetical protein VMA36_13665 [Candidatus Limnocylindria bacterium]|jgi:hypothetical protein|nr:hypothetical protein [Candidatus Limnocylindria bacterium]
MMNWQDELLQIVRDAGRLPSFQEWLRTSGYEDVPAGLTGPVQARTVMRTLYLRYLEDLRKAA